MIDLGSLRVKIGEDVPVRDFVDNPDQHSWEVYFEFPDDKNRDPADTPTGKKYGSGDTFAAIYDAISKKFTPFIDVYFQDFYPDSDVRETGDALLQDFNASIGIQVNNINNRENETYKMHRSTEVNEARYINAIKRWDEYDQKVSAFQGYVENLEENLKRTRSGAPDRRTSKYREWVSELGRLNEMYEESDRLAKRKDIERTRYVNSSEREDYAVSELNKIKRGFGSRIKKQYERLAEDFAKEIKDDIMKKAENGELPTQNLPLADKTIEKRLSVGLLETPRFWATGQLVESIVITCTLV